MERLTFLGMGFNFYDHDRFAVESQGDISDRTREHLGASDRAVIAMRRLMFRTIEDLQDGEVPTLSASNGVDPVADLVVVSQKVPAATENKAVWREFRPKEAKTPALAP